MSPTEIASAYVQGRLRLLKAALLLQGCSDLWLVSWNATGGPAGPLAAIYIAADVADRIGYFEGDAVRWHPEVRDKKLAEFAEAEARLARQFEAACQVILGAATSRDAANQDRA
jgi:hypothetical protein